MSKIILAEQASAPDTPGSGKVAIFVDTNGDLAWIDDAGNVIKIAAAGSYTLTIPATGTAALRDVAQTFSAQQTFSQAPIAPGMKPTADSTTAIQLMNAAGSAILTVDTTNGKIDVDALQIGGVDVPFAAGTWTPALTFSGGNTGITYASRVGVYRRFGDIVWVTAQMALSSKGSSTGAASISGFPYTPSATICLWPMRWENMASNMIYMVGYQSGTAVLLLGTTAAATSVSPITDAQMSNNTEIYMTGLYMI